MADADPIPPGLRAAKKDAVRARIADAVIALLAEGDVDLSHDLVAARAGVARRTVYRYFPDRAALLDSAWSQVTALAGPNVTFPRSERDLIDTLDDIYTGFDRIAPLATIVRSTRQGRAVRRSQNRRRVEAYRHATADAVAALPEPDRVLATAMLQVLHTTPWLEMRDTWGLEGRQIARAARWAIQALLDDLRARGSRPLDEA